MIPLLLLALPAMLAPLDGGGAAPLQAAHTETRPITIDWDLLPPLAYRNLPTLTPAIRRFVDGEVAAGHCVPPRDTAGRYTITLDVAVLVDGRGRILRTLPRAIDCPTVEQFGAGLALSFARENLLPRTHDDARWFRATFVFPQP
ncbi:hypothetical protein ACFO8O_03050 [Hephaestia sp. GCM10023244]|uniref:hypothetical protein n=1 Tax=unclassified Hephaestia TaxID=2631281 RepID=UPI0020777914|nr:hypothetical protein [Hephaestia sp. MAHUQ-44]MCM8729946.1 hypothetical protein [Hephaestia sp. MAHUQ-44]